jgi:hypothetical protein
MKDLPIGDYGSGAGSMEFDLEKHYPAVYKLKYKIIMQIAKEGLALHMNIISDLNSMSKVQACKFFRTVYKVAISITKRYFTSPFSMRS